MIQSSIYGYAHVCITLLYGVLRNLSQLPRRYCTDTKAQPRKNLRTFQSNLLIHLNACKLSLKSQPHIDELLVVLSSSNFMSFLLNQSVSRIQTNKISISEKPKTRTPNPTPDIFALSDFPKKIVRIKNKIKLSRTDCSLARSL